MAELHPLVREVIRGLRDGFAWKAIADGIAERRWGEDQLVAYSAMLEAQQNPPQPKARLYRRHRPTEPPPPCAQWVIRHSLAAVFDGRIRGGATKLLQHVLSLAGGVGKPLLTLTCWLATRLKVSRRCIQLWRRQLVEAGYLLHRYDRRTGEVTLTVTRALALPERAFGAEYAENNTPPAGVLRPAPRPWFSPRAGSRGKSTGWMAGAKTDSPNLPGPFESPALRSAARAVGDVIGRMATPGWAPGPRKPEPG